MTTSTPRLHSKAMTMVVEIRATTGDWGKKTKDAKFCVFLLGPRKTSSNEDSLLLPALQKILDGHHRARPVPCCQRFRDEWPVLD